MIAPSEPEKRSFADENDERLSLKDPDRGPVESEQSLPLYWLWFLASLVLATAGGWGVIGGWWLGLPGGGEIRQNMFSDDSLSWRDLLVAIPHPDLSELPFVPKSSGDGFEVRKKFQSRLAWKESSIAVNPPSLNILDVTKFVADRIDKAQSNAKQATVPSPSQSSAIPSPPIPFFTTNIGSAAAVLDLPPTRSDRSMCLAIRPDNGAGACIILPVNIPLNTPTPFAVEGATRDFTLEKSSLRFVNADIFPDLQGRASRLILAEDAGSGLSPPTSLSSVTLGTELSGSPPVAKPTLWAGGLFGNVIKVSADPANGEMTAARLSVPSAAAIELVAFVSPDRGWIWTSTSLGERGISPPTAAQTFDGGASWQRLSYRWLPAPWVFLAFVLGAIAFERGSTARLGSRPVATEKYIADHGVSDDPIGLKDEDALGLMPIARSMARFLRNTATKPTVAIGVTGPWGSGKTSLMNLVKEELHARDVRTVWFNAWHNQKEENLLAALLAAIRGQAVPPLWTISGFVYRLRVAWMRIGADPNATIALLGVAITAFVLVATHLEEVALILGQFADRIGSLLPGSTPGGASASATNPVPGAAATITTIGVSTGGISAIIFAGKKLWDLFRPLKSIPADLLSTLSWPSSIREIDQQLSFRYRFASEFAIFCDTLRRPPHPGLVIFIDDLDRCAPKQTVDILEAINFVTSAGRCFVVLGLDENRVKAAIADSYKDMTLRLDPDPSRPLARTAEALQQQKLADLNDFASHYLEKLIHLVVPVPRSRQETVELLLGLKPPSRKQAEVPAWRTAAKTAFDMLGTVLVVGFLMSVAWLGFYLATRSFPTVAASSSIAAKAPAATDIGKPSSAPAGTAAGGATTRLVPTSAPLTSAELSDAGLTTRGVLGTVPPLAAVLTFALLLMILSFQFLPRLQIEPVVSDGPQFQEALKIWLAGITKTRDTPRAVKRFVNRLRFMAMRLRDLSAEASKGGGAAPLDETDLVAMAVIEDLDRDCLGATDEQLKARQGAGEAKKEEAEIILSALESFRDAFHRNPYQNKLALPTFRLLAGLVSEGRGETATTGDTRRS